MALREKVRLMDGAEMERVLRRLAAEAAERLGGLDGVVLAGIHRRGVFLARRLAERMGPLLGGEVPCGELDITLYRDDLSTLSEGPLVRSTRLPVEVEGSKVVLVDDVIYTGRTARAALEAILDLGRPALVRLCVLVDRGHREMPIHPDLVGRVVPTSRSEVVEVRLREVDGVDEVVICERGERS